MDGRAGVRPWVRRKGIKCTILIFLFLQYFLCGLPQEILYQRFKTGNQGTCEKSRHIPL